MTTLELIERGVGANCLSDAYDMGRADQKKEDNEFFNHDGAWELEKQKIRAEVIKEFVKAYENADDESCETCNKQEDYCCIECFMNKWLKRGRNESSTRIF